MTEQEHIETGFASISLGVYQLLNQGKADEAYHTLSTVINLLMEDRQSIRQRFPGVKL